jgi:ribosomal protein S18 acetylase RimI-like enzyme
MQTSSSISLNLNTTNTESFHILSNSNLSITFRFLQSGDQSEVKSLCHDWFPIKYPDTWYDDIVHDKKYFALAACDISTKRIVALIIANIFPLGNCNHEDQKILHRKFSYTTSVCYILILGVVKEYRRQGLASILLENLLNKLYKYETCKAIYLHVLYSNKQAIEFYQSKLFQYRIHLPYYYLIQGEHLDAYCFARYINGKKRKKNKF